MEARPREILICQTSDGLEPFTAWLDALPVRDRAIVRIRLDRIEDGNFGDVRPVGGGLSELRIDFGPGYRIYFGQRRSARAISGESGSGKANDEVHLICAGSKRTQRDDIAFAQRFWREHE